MCHQGGLGYGRHLNKNKCLINKCFIKLLDDEEGNLYTLFKSKYSSSKYLTHANLNLMVYICKRIN